MKKIISNTLIAFALVAALLLPVLASGVNNAGQPGCYAAFFPNSIDDN